MQIECFLCKKTSCCQDEIFITKLRNSAEKLNSRKYSFSGKKNLKIIYAA